MSAQVKQSELVIIPDRDWNLVERRNSLRCGSCLACMFAIAMAAVAGVFGTIASMNTRDKMVKDFNNAVGSWTGGASSSFAASSAERLKVSIDALGPGMLNAGVCLPSRRLQPCTTTVVDPPVVNAGEDMRSYGGRDRVAQALRLSGVSDGEGSDVALDSAGGDYCTAAVLSYPANNIGDDINNAMVRFKLVAYNGHISVEAGALRNLTRAPAPTPTSATLSLNLPAVMFTRFIKTCTTSQVCARRLEEKEGQEEAQQDHEEEGEEREEEGQQEEELLDTVTEDGGDTGSTATVTHSMARRLPGGGGGGSRGGGGGGGSRGGSGGRIGGGSDGGDGGGGSSCTTVTTCSCATGVEHSSSVYAAAPCVQWYKLKQVCAIMRADGKLDPNEGCAVLHPHFQYGRTEQPTTARAALGPVRTAGHPFEDTKDYGFARYEPLSTSEFSSNGYMTLGATVTMQTDVVVRSESDPIVALIRTTNGRMELQLQEMTLEAQQGVAYSCLVLCLLTAALCIKCTRDLEKASSAVYAAPVLAPQKWTKSSTPPRAKRTS